MSTTVGQVVPLANDKLLIMKSSANHAKGFNFLILIPIVVCCQ